MFIILVSVFSTSLLIKESELEHSLKSDSGLDTTAAGADNMSTKTLMQQNIELRRKLEEEHAGYKRKLQAYQDGQHRQAQLVQKLQAKLLQYKKRCQELEDSMHSKDLEITRVISSKVKRHSAPLQQHAQQAT
ncbi:rootletin [Elysia marginata]|uniref:Rootletin n=1 Tax=Elysia marginata TaxID=1093978 RepID=A0AAV4F0K4_9GAST|nr:rootletin [Elysia marginata]